MSIIHSSPGDLLLAAAHPETGPPAPLTRDLLPAVAHPKSQAPGILTGGFAPYGRTSPPAWRRALQKGTKKPLEQVLRPLCTLLR